VQVDEFINIFLQTTFQCERAIRHGKHTQYLKVLEASWMQGELSVEVVTTAPWPADFSDWLRDFEIIRQLRVNGCVGII